MRITIINTIFLFLFANTLWSQNNVIFEHYSTEDGLSHGNITYIFEDSDGYLWFCTWDGINRFDGENFTAYKTSPGDNVILSSNRIDLMEEDSLGFIWILTYDQRVFRFDRKTETFYDLSKQFKDPDMKIENIFILSTGEVWLQSIDLGLLRIITDTTDYSIEIETFSKNDAPKNHLPDNDINRIFEDSSENIWVFTNSGASCLLHNHHNNSYAVRAFSFHTDSVFNNTFFSSINQSDNYLFFGTDKGKLFVFDLQTEQLSQLPLHNNFEITSIHKGKGNNLYIGTFGNGLFRYDIKENKIIAHNVSPIIKYIKNTFIYEEEIIWIETGLKGVLKTDSSLNTIKHFKQETDIVPSIDIKNYCTFQIDKKGRLWITLSQGGFGYYNKEKDTFEYFYNNPNDQNAKFSNYVSRSFIDSRGILWLCTYPKGVEKITILDNKFNHIETNPESKNKVSNEIRAFLEDSHGFLWVSTKGGEVYIYDKNYQQINILTEKDGIDNSLIYSIIEDKNGNIWMGSKGKGLYKITLNSPYEKKSFKIKNYRHNPQDSLSLSDDKIYSLLEDNWGNIWIGTFGGGINKLEDKNGQVIFLNTNNSFKEYPISKGNRIRDIQDDKYGNIWLGTTQGLIQFNPNYKQSDSIKFKHYSKIPGDINSLGSNNIYYIYNDHTDTLWLGTLGGGLQKMIRYPVGDNPPEFKTYTKANGLPSNVVLSIEEDNLSKLWISTENGLSCFNRDNNSFTNYDEFDGLNTLSFSEASSCKRKSGELCFGTLNGFYYFSPQNLKAREENINLKLIRFSLFNREQKPGEPGSPLKYSISHTKEIKLNYEQSMFSIEYMGLSFIAEHKIQYAYILEGFDKSWHYVKNQNIATYTNIPPGKYKFRVRIIGRDNNSIISERSLKINIPAPPWKTKWAYLLYIILILALIEIARRIITTMIRLRNKVVIEKELTDYKLKFFTNISHELRTPLTLIINPTEEIKRTEKLSKKGAELINLIDKNSKRMLRLINQLLDFRKIQNQKMRLKISNSDIVSFVFEISSSFREFAKEKKIIFNTTSNIEKLKVWFDKDKLDIVLFNLLSNAFKFTEKGKSIDVFINFKPENNIVIIEVRDEGKGIPDNKSAMIFKRFTDISDSSDVIYAGSGIGLSLSKELIELHKGKITFKSIEGKGSSFYIELKLGKNHFDSGTRFIEDKELTKQHAPQIADVSEENELKPKLLNKNLPTLLIVEDNADLRKMLKMQFYDNFNILEAEDGEVGFKKAVDIIPELIISDIMMPKMDGIEFTDKAKNNVRTSHIPIILLTSKSSADSKIEGLRYGADAYITKPFNNEILKAQVNNLLNQRKVLFEKYSNTSTDIIPKHENTPIITEKDNLFLNKLTEVIEKNIENTQLNIETIAKEVGMGRTLFFKKIKGLSGLSPIDFLKDYRLSRALDLLKSGRYNISEVSYMVGFSEPGYFTKCFKDKYKTTPSEFQKHNTNE